MHRNKWLKTIAIAAIYLGIWEAASLLVGKPLLLPGPYETVVRLFSLLTISSTWISALLTMLRVLSGYLMGVAAGVLLAILTAKISFADSLLKPLRGMIKATPVTSFILLALLWLTSDLVPLFIAFLMVLPIVWMNVYEAVQNTDPKLIEMAHVFRISKWKTIKTLYVPSVLPSFLAACTTALGFAWKSGVAAEIIALPKRSIGNFLYQSKLALETTDLFAWTLFLIALSMLLEMLLVRLLRRIRHD